MARLVGVDLPREKRVDIGLTHILGVGRIRSKEILKKANVSDNTKVKDLTEDEVVALRNVLREYKLEGDLKRETSLNIKRMMEIGSYRGQRHKKNLPARGQRSKTNARTKRGSKKTVASKKKVAKA
jgi:small subunit ribosomal protein S13